MIEIVSSIFSDPTDMKLEINYIKNPDKTWDIWRLNIINESINKLKRKSTVYGDKWKQKHTGSKYVGCGKSGSKREGHSDTTVPKETRTIPNK